MPHPFFDLSAPGREAEEADGFDFLENMPSIRSVTMKPPTMLIVPKAIAIVPITYSSPSLAKPTTISPPSMTMPWIALVCHTSGAGSVAGAFELHPKPAKAAGPRFEHPVKVPDARPHD